MDDDYEMRRLMNAKSDPIRILCLQQRVKTREALLLYDRGWDSLLSAADEAIFSDKVPHFLRAYASFRQAIKADPQYGCPKIALFLTGEILTELGFEIEDLPENLEYRVSLLRNPRGCQVLAESWEFLQKLQSSEHKYECFAPSNGSSLFERVRDSVRDRVVDYSIDWKRDHGQIDVVSEMELDDLSLHVYVASSMIRTPGNQAPQRVAMAVRGEGIPTKLRVLLQEYNFKMV